MDYAFDIEECEAQIRASGKTINEFCADAGVHRATWQRWKAGKVYPNYRTLQRVAKALEQLAA